QKYFEHLILVEILKYSVPEFSEPVLEPVHRFDLHCLWLVEEPKLPIPEYTSMMTASQHSNLS
ncbi:17186_t:CDS:1, partial [Rhizophagus irregularis]